MPSQITELKSKHSTAEIEASDGDIELQLPLTLAGWDITELVANFGPHPVIVTSADGDHFLGTVTDTDQERYTVTVELT